MRGVRKLFSFEDDANENFFSDRRPDLLETLSLLPASLPVDDGARAAVRGVDSGLDWMVAHGVGDKQMSVEEVGLLGQTGDGAEHNSVRVPICDANVAWVVVGF